MTPPDPTVVTDLIEAFRRSKTMFAAVNLGVFDFLETGPASADQVAAKLGTNRDATARLLEGCTGLGLLTYSAGTFANTAATSTYLCRSSERALTGYVLYSNEASYKLWEHLEDAIREGTPRWQQAFGWPAPIFDHFFSTDEKMRTFIKAMHGFGVMTSPAVVRAFDLSRFHTLADLGAATGHLTIAACEAWPQLRGIVFDMDRVLTLSKAEVEKSSARDRISFVSGDFFTEPLPKADLYALGRVLHDWSENKIHLLLRRIFDALPADGALLIAEKLLVPDKTGPIHAHMQSLNMLVCTEGKERNLTEYRDLLEAAGFSDVQGKQTGEAVDAILARKAG